jgi:hypothetical protein
MHPFVFYGSDYWYNFKHITTEYNLKIWTNRTEAMSVQSWVSLTTKPVKNKHVTEMPTPSIAWDMQLRKEKRNSRFRIKNKQI